MKDELLDKTFRFPCDRWLAKNEDDGQIMRELACANNDYLDLNEKTSKAGTYCTPCFKVVFVKTQLRELQSPDILRQLSLLLQSES